MKCWRAYNPKVKASLRKTFARALHKFCAGELCKPLRKSSAESEMSTRPRGCGGARLSILRSLKFNFKYEYKHRILHRIIIQKEVRKH